MKLKARVGPGVFSDDLGHADYELEDGSVIGVDYIAATQDIIFELLKSGIKFVDITDPLEAYETSKALFDKIVVNVTLTKPGAAAKPLEGKFKERVMQIPELSADLFERAKRHGIEIEETDQGNSES